MTAKELNDSFQKMMLGIDLGDSDNKPTPELLNEIFQPNNQKGLYLFSIYTMTINNGEIVLEDELLVSFTSCIRHNISNPIVFLTNCFLTLGLIEKVEDTETRIKYKFLNEDLKKMFEQLEELELKKMQSKYSQMISDGCTQEEILRKIIKELEYEASKCKKH